MRRRRRGSASREEDGEANGEANASGSKEHSADGGGSAVSEENGEENAVGNLGLPRLSTSSNLSGVDVVREDESVLSRLSRMQGQAFREANGYTATTKTMSLLFRVNSKEDMEQKFGKLEIYMIRVL
jgi:hypothetical protein